MKKRIDALRHEAGFTLIEVMVGIFLLLLGVLGVAKMADQANVSSNQSKARVGATNLARELLEQARSFNYADLQGTVPAASGSTDLEDAYAGIGVTDAQAAVNGFQVARRGITYRVSIFTCVSDDPHDGVRATPASGPDVNSAGAYCLGSPAAGSGTTTDLNPDDARKLEVSVSWSVNQVTASCRNASQTTTSGQTGGQGRACVTQSQLIANPSGGLGPAIKTLEQAPSTPGIIQAGTDQVDMKVTTVSPAQSVTWTSDTGASGTANAVGTDGLQWTFTWGPFGSTSPADGAHIVTAQAFLLNAGGVPKEASVTLNRFVPAVPTGGTGGIDTRLSDAAVVSWSPNSDQDIFGYTVYRAAGASPNLTTSPADEPVCSTTSVSSTLCFDAPSNLQSFASNAACLDPVAQGAGHECINYYVVPFDSMWTSPVGNPTTYQSTDYCQGLAWSSVDVPAPPVSASSSTAPITASPLWGTARAGCPSDFISIDYTDLQGNHPPDAPAGLTCTTSAGQPVIGWTPPTSPDQDGDDVASYRIYRDPQAGGTPQYNDQATTIGYNLGTTNSYRDASADPTQNHDYWISAVDDRFQESSAIHIQWTAGTCP